MINIFKDAFIRGIEAAIIFAGLFIPIIIILTIVAIAIVLIYRLVDKLSK